MSRYAWHERDVRIGDVRYPYRVGTDCMDRIAWSVAALEPDRAIVVTDRTVEALYGDAFARELERYVRVRRFACPPGEAAKSLECLGTLLEWAISAGASRRSVVVAFGGGVPGNLGGMLAALLFRGVRLVHVPTTTLAAADSVLSIKQAVNSTRGKNHVGLYHAPEAVFVETDVFRTLPERQITSGWCEAVKNCLAIRPQAAVALRRFGVNGELASDAALRWLLLESLEAKAAVTRQDPREQWAGLVLEYGHTVGHAVELCDQRARGEVGLAHGEAIALGMIAAARVAAEVTGLSEGDVEAHVELVAAVGAPLQLPDQLDVDEVMEVVRADNKRGYLPDAAGDAPMVLLRKLGAPVVGDRRPLVPVPLDVVANAVAGLRSGEAAGVDSSAVASGVT